MQAGCDDEDRLFRRSVGHLRFIKGAARSLPKCMCFTTSSALFFFFFSVFHLTHLDKPAPLSVRPSALGSHGRIVKLITSSKNPKLNPKLESEHLPSAAWCRSRLPVNNLARGGESGTDCSGRSWRSQHRGEFENTLSCPAIMMLVHQDNNIRHVSAAINNPI